MPMFPYLCCLPTALGYSPYIMLVVPPNLTMNTVLADLVSNFCFFLVVVRGWRL